MPLSVFYCSPSIFAQLHFKLCQEIHCKTRDRCSQIHAQKNMECRSGGNTSNLFSIFEERVILRHKEA